MLRYLNVLSLEEADGDGTKALVFQRSGKKYFVCPRSAIIQRKIFNHVAWGQRCVALCQRVPRTAAQFVKCTVDLDKELEPLVGATEANGYLRLWLKRAWMILLLTTYDRQLAFGKMSVQKFIQCWPDQHRLLQRLLTSGRASDRKSSHSPLAVALKALDYTDKPELLSMHACLVDDQAAQTILRQRDCKWIERNAKEMEARLVSWRRKEGIWPHPGIFFPTCWDLV